MDSESSKNLTNTLILVLNASSALLVMGSLFLIQVFSLLYGVASGILIESNDTALNAGQPFQQIVTQSAYFHEGILESYVLAVIAIMLLETSFLLFMRRTERTGSGARRYVAMHTGFTVIYGLIFAIIFTDSSQYLTEIYVWAIYIGLVVSLVVGVYLNYSMRLPTEHQAKIRRNLTVDPNTPFSNIMELREKIFGNMKGHLRVVDKHFNSEALANFHRLIVGNMEQFDSITVITSSDMLDTSFGKNMVDFKKELETNKIAFGLRFMDENDKIEQHERIMLDDTVAYKIPPFNIINKRSEHIILINHADAQKRFNHLYNRGISFENYSVRKGRDDEEPKPQIQP